MSSEYVVHETPRLKIEVVEQSMRYELVLESKHMIVGALNDTDDPNLALRATADADDDVRIRYVSTDALSASEFADLIVELAKVYSYQHGGSGLLRALKHRLLEVLV